MPRLVVFSRRRGRGDSLTEASVRLGRHAQRRRPGRFLDVSRHAETTKVTPPSSSTSTAETASGSTAEAIAARPSPRVRRGESARSNRRSKMMPIRDPGRPARVPRRRSRAPPRSAIRCNPRVHLAARARDRRSPRDATDSSWSGLHNIVVIAFSCVLVVGHGAARRSRRGGPPPVGVVTPPARQLPPPAA